MKDWRDKKVQPGDRFAKLEFAGLLALALFSFGVAVFVVIRHFV